MAKNDVSHPADADISGDSENVDAAAEDWWQEAANEHGGKIPAYALPGIATDFAEAIGMSAEEALAYAHKIGVVAEESNPAPPPADILTPTTPEPEKQGEDPVKQKQMTHSEQVVWEAIQKHGNDRSQLLNALTKSGRTATDGNLSQIISTLRRKGYTVPYSEHKGGRRPGAKGSGSRKADSGGSPPETPAPVPPAAAPEPVPASEPAPDPVQAAHGSATGVEALIARLEAQITQLQQDLAAAKRTRELLAQQK